MAGRLPTPDRLPLKFASRPEKGDRRRERPYPYLDDVLKRPQDVVRCTGSAIHSADDVKALIISILMDSLLIFWRLRAQRHVEQNKS